MGFVSPEVSTPGTELAVEVRGTTLAVTVAPLPFVPQRYYRNK
jgi:aminomethyltransferase